MLQIVIVYSYNGCIETDITLLKMKECLNVINEKVNEQMQRYLGDEKTNSVSTNDQFSDTINVCFVLIRIFRNICI